MKINFSRAVQNKRLKVDWFTDRLSTWAYFLTPFKAQGTSCYLEIGSYEGLSAFFVAWFMPESEVTCIDAWIADGIDNQQSLDDAEKNFDFNLHEFSSRITKIKAKSHEALISCELTKKSFDIIYIDGSHAAKDVLKDAILAWPLLRVGGVMIFDDIVFNFFKKGENPRHGIMSFLDSVHGKFKFLFFGRQLFIQKKSEPDQ